MDDYQQSASSNDAPGVRVGRESVWPDSMVDPIEMAVEVSDVIEPTAGAHEDRNPQAHLDQWVLANRLANESHGHTHALEFKVNKLSPHWYETVFFDSNTVILFHRPERFEIEVLRCEAVPGEDEDKRLIMFDSNGTGWKVTKVFCHACFHLKDFMQISASGQWLAYRGLKMAKRIRGEAKEPKVDSLRPILCQECVAPGVLPADDLRFLTQLADKNVVKVEVKSKVIVTMPGSGERFCHFQTEPVAFNVPGFWLSYSESMNGAADRFRQLLTSGPSWSLPIPDSASEGSSSPPMGAPSSMASSSSEDDTI